MANVVNLDQRLYCSICQFAFLQNANVSFHNNQESFEIEYKNNVKIAELKIDNLKEEKRKYYEDWKFEKLDKTEFIKLSEEIDLKINQYNQDIELYTSTYKETVKKIRKNDYWIGHYKRNRKIKVSPKQFLI